MKAVDRDQPANTDIDRFWVELQRRRLLAKMFEIEGEPVRLGHYELQRELGRGAMGVVYAARDSKLDRRVAIKRLLTGIDADLRERLVREARAMAKLAHPNVVPIYEIGEERDAAFIVMEYVEGVTLRDWLEQEPRSLAAIFEVFVAAGRGLVAVHGKGMVHRDFKPDNVMVGVDGRVRVMDFGLVRFEPAEDDLSLPEVLEPSVAVITHSGALVGTPAYMAPEQLTGGRADAATDQFCFCVTLYEALHGHRPFRATTLLELLAEIEAQRISAPSAKVPSWLHELVVRGLRCAPSERYPSMATLLDALEAGARETGSSSRPPPAYVFVAYARADLSAVRRLCEGLIDHGVRPWIDLWEVPPTAAAGPWQARALAQAPAVLLCHGLAGHQRLHQEYGEVLRARMTADPGSVYQATLSAGSSTGAPSTPGGVLLDDARWFEGLAELARLLGADRRREGWLGDEAARAKLDADELCPYPGKRAYAEADARWLFGRGREIDDLLELLRFDGARFVTVIGPPGSGKSSLIAAGLVPALRHGAIAGRSWHLARLCPGKHPCESLALALVNLARTAEVDEREDEDPIVEAIRVARLRDQLIVDPTTLKLVLDRLVDGSTPGSGQVLLVIDQLEELWTLADLEGSSPTAEALRFILNLSLATAGEGPLRVMAALRSDFMSRCFGQPSLAGLLESGVSFKLTAPAKQSLQDAIVRPARRVGFEIEPKLLERLVTTATEPGAELSRLQQQLCELWRRRDAGRRLLLGSTDDLTRELADSSARAEASMSQRSPAPGSSHVGLVAARAVFRQRRHAAGTGRTADPDVVFMASAISKIYGERGFGLVDIDLILRRGEITGLVGANGNGKTTLLRIIAGELAISGGQLRYPGLADPGQWRAIKSGISYVSQSPLRWYGPLQETLRHEAALHGVVGKDNDDEVEFMLHRFGLEAYADAKWSEISGGYKTRFELVRALMKRPQLLVLDEPLAPLDVAAQQLYLQDLREIASTSTEPPAVILSSQHLHEVESIADRVLVLVRGRPRFSGSLEQLREQRLDNRFELTFIGDTWGVADAIARLGPDARLEQVGVGYMLTVSRTVTLEQVVRALTDAKLALSFIRDISGSTCRLLQEQES